MLLDKNNGLARPQGRGAGQGQNPRACKTCAATCRVRAGGRDGGHPRQKAGDLHLRQDTLATGPLRPAAAQQEVEMSAQMDGIFAEARKGLEQTGLEAGPRERVGARLASYRADLTRQEEQWCSAVHCTVGASVQVRGG